MLVWIDVETTGLSEVDNYLLEVGCTITDDKLDIEFEHSYLVENNRSIEELIENASPFVREMHEASGLWNDLRQSDLALSADRIDDVLTSVIKEYTGEEKAPLCGSNVANFDRRWLRKFCPMSNEALHYWNLDVSSLKEAHRRFFPHNSSGPVLWSGGKKRHRVLDDIADRIDELKFYLNRMGWGW